MEQTTDRGAEGRIIVRDVVKTFGSVRALDGVNLDVRSGEVVALLGANGAGKSTLMRVLATIVRPDAGTATVCGHDVVNDARRVRATIGLALADERSLYWRLTPAQNLEYFAALHGLGRKAGIRRSTELIEQVGLGPAADRMVATFSTGMRARLVIARALIASPNVLLLDEPTRSLDPVASAELRTMVRNIGDEQGLATLYATHDLHEAAEIGSRSLIISQGRIVATAPAGVQASALEALLLETAA